jgi:alkylated DNA nucleotide flippase Atl1
MWLANPSELNGHKELPRWRVMKNQGTSNLLPGGVDSQFCLLQAEKSRHDKRPISLS